MGILVTGSIIRARRFIFTSIEASPGLGHLLAHQAVVSCAGHQHLHVGSQKVALLGSEIYDAVTRSVPAPLILAARFTANEQIKPGTQQRSVAFALNCALLFLQNRKPPALFFFGNRIWHRKRGGVENAGI